MNNKYFTEGEKSIYPGVTTVISVGMKLTNALDFIKNDIPIHPMAFHMSRTYNLDRGMMEWATANNVLFNQVTHKTYEDLCSVGPNRKDGNWEVVVGVIYMGGFGIRHMITYTKGPIPCLTFFVIEE